MNVSQEEAIVSDWTLTQLHIVAVIKEKGKANNIMLSEILNVSKPAITKAVKKLLEHNILEKKHNKKIIKKRSILFTNKIRRDACTYPQSIT